MFGRMLSWLDPISRPVLAGALRTVVRLSQYPPVGSALGQLYDVGQSSSLQNQMRRVKSRYEIHATVRWGYGTDIRGEGAIRIGENTYLGTGCFVVAGTRESKVEIGRNCQISHNVHIRTEVHHRFFHLRDAQNTPTHGKDVCIGDFVWIGANVFIGGGITVGENSIIGANSVVTHDVPPNTVAAGTPARVIHSKEEFSEAK